ncbi:MAG: hypothetical protein J4F38_11345, partial [Pseudomonadales bacterium]|nr:hypothetical protein [Pseudomonadales bacterium]
VAGSTRINRVVAVCTEGSPLSSRRKQAAQATVGFAACAGNPRHLDEDYHCFDHPNGDKFTTLVAR